MTSPSGWCSPDCSPRFHIKCQDRIDKGQLEWCVCEARGGHQKPVVERDSTPEPLALGGDSCDNGGAKSDPALRQQPGSRPNSEEESDVTQSTRRKPSTTRPRGRG